MKTYWWRIISFVLPIVILMILYFLSCSQEFSRCIWGASIPISRTSFHFSLSILAVSPFLFFVLDEVFKKWLRFAGVWFVAAAIFISMAPEYQGGWMPIGPTKESVSTWMSGLFVVVSLAKLAWDSRKSK